MTDRICWEPDGNNGFEGHVGTLEPWAFQMWQSPCDSGDYVLGSWVLLAAFPRADGMRSVARDDPETLKAEAERWLEEFVSSLGAVFEPEPVKSRAWHVDWAVVDRDQDGNAILRHKPTGGRYKILPVEEC